MIDASNKLTNDVKSLVASKTKLILLLISSRSPKVTLLILKDILLTVASIFILEDEGNITILSSQAKNLKLAIEFIYLYITFTKKYGLYP